jgi:hypothetical protein
MSIVGPIFLQSEIKILSTVRWILDRVPYFVSVDIERSSDGLEAYPTFGLLRSILPAYCGEAALSVFCTKSDRRTHANKGTSKTGQTEQCRLYRQVDPDLCKSTSGRYSFFWLGSAYLSRTVWFCWQRDAPPVKSIASSSMTSSVSRAKMQKSFPLQDEIAGQPTRFLWVTQQS